MPTVPDTGSLPLAKACVQSTSSCTSSMRIQPNWSNAAR